MKTTNQFDYPTAVASNYKAFREQPTNPNPNNKQHYQNVIKQEGTNERGRAKYEQQKKKQLQKSEQQKRLKQQIERKKKQLQELERKRMEAIQNEIRAAELAKLKEEQDKVKRIQQMEKAKEADSNAQFRFKDALRRLEAEKDESSYKERQAQHRRKVNIEIEKEERQKASKFRSLQSIRQQEQRIRAQQEQRKNVQLYRQGLGRHGLAKNVDYSKTCFHNPAMIFKNEAQEISAIEKGQIQEQRQKSLSIQKKERAERSRQRSIERHQKAMQRMQQERQYNSYCAETQQQQIQYNLNRIEAGKKNQYIGMKPLTLDQMQNNKKIRSEQEFQNMFIQAPQIQANSQPANHYYIVQNQFGKPKASPFQNWRREQMNMTKQNDSRPTNYPQYDMPNCEEEDVEQRYISEVPRPIEKFQKQQTEDAKWKIEGKSERKQNNHEQLSYSQSEEDSIM